jgi:hypothetical protein
MSADGKDGLGFAAVSDCVGSRSAGEWWSRYVRGLSRELGSGVGVVWERG